ncbi:MAG: hypothetical protein WBD28_09085 [Candidatus Zixiibacteriota bacterium]
MITTIKTSELATGAFIAVINKLNLEQFIDRDEKGKITNLKPFNEKITSIYNNLYTTIQKATANKK